MVRVASVVNKVTFAGVRCCVEDVIRTDQITLDYIRLDYIRLDQIRLDQIDANRLMRSIRLDQICSDMMQTKSDQMK